MTTRRVPRAMLVLLAVLTVAPWCGRAFPVAAASLTFTVNSPVDAPDATPGDGICADTAGQCTVRAATQEADAQPAGSVISITVPAGRYALTLGALSLATNTITVVGAGARTTVIDGNNASQVVNVAAGTTARLAGVTITAGNSATNGGGIANAGRLALASSVVMSSTAPAGSGGGLYNTGTMTVSGSLVMSNTAPQPSSALAGGGIYNQGTLTVVNSAILDNSASGGVAGGGIENDCCGTAMVTHSIIAHNSSGYLGGGINVGGVCCSAGATVVLSDSVVISNTALYGGGIGVNGFGGSPSDLTVANSTIADNTATYTGGGIFTSGSTLTLTTSAIRGNTANTGNGNANGGGIYIGGGSVSVADSTLSSNAANYVAGGGGIYNDLEGTLTMTNSTVVSNTAYQGGGIDNGSYSTLTVTNSTIASNTASGQSYGYGGAIANLGTLAVTNTTIVSNTAGPFSDFGGGGGLYSGGPVSLSYVTVAGNSDGLDSATAFGSYPIALTGTIVANSTTGPNCTGPMSDSQGYNLDSGTSCGFGQPTDLSNTNPMLGPLQNNGGPTQTMALLPGSLAIDHGGTHANGCPATDQRGMPRPDEGADNGACDMGAYESQGIG